MFDFEITNSLNHTKVNFELKKRLSTPRFTLTLSLIKILYPHSESKIRLNYDPICQLHPSWWLLLLLLLLVFISYILVKYNRWGEIFLVQYELWLLDKVRSANFETGPTVSPVHLLPSFHLYKYIEHVHHNH